MNKLMILGSVAATLLIFIVGIIFVNKPVKSYSISEILPTGTASKGNSSAKVYLVEFSDFQCPACLAAQQYIDKIIEKYGDRIVFGYRHFPLPKHTFALKAAYAAEAAKEQGKFWEIHKYLFENQDLLSDKLIEESGKTIGLDEEAFKIAIKSSNVKDRITKDLIDAKKLGVNSTPTFFLNGKKLDLKSFDDLDTLVAAEVNKNETR